MSNEAAGELETAARFDDRVENYVAHRAWFRLSESRAGE